LITAVEGLQFDRDGDSLIVTIDRGDENHFTGPMTQGVIDAVATAEAEDLRFIRLRAEGSVFCTGRERVARTPIELRAEAARIVRANESFRNSALTVLAEVQGDAAGFGTGLVAGADIAVASEDARFWWPEIVGGLAPTIVISWLAKLIPYKIAFDLVTGGRPIDARRAQELGLVTDVVPRDEVVARADERIKLLSEMSSEAIREIKQFFIRIRSLDPATAALTSVEALALSAARLQAAES
jgi:methylglutaconyl-CoA hydratase